jgi:hypothetical protein
MENNFVVSEGHETPLGFSGETREVRTKVVLYNSLNSQTIHQTLIQFSAAITSVFLYKFHLSPAVSCLRCSIVLVCSPSTAGNLRPAFFWNFTQLRMIIPTRHFGTTYQSHFQGSNSPSSQAVFLDCLIPEHEKVCPETSVRKYHSTLP